MSYPSDLEIANAANKKPIDEIAIFPPVSGG